MQNTEKVQSYARQIKNVLPEGFTPQCGLVLGTGLGGLVAEIRNPVTIPYADLAGFPQSTVASHAGRFVAGTINSVPVIVQQGRCHIYEGRTPAEVVAGIWVMGALGIHCLVLTNAAGSLNPLFPTGNLMLIDDHLNLTGLSPLTGPNDETLGVRFPDMSRVYDAQCIAIAEKAAATLSIPLHKGVYVFTPGPQFETRAETRAFRALGADAVGMSTALEAIAAHHMGIKILGISALSNQNLPDCMAPATLEEVVAAADLYGPQLARLISMVLPKLAKLAQTTGQNT